MVGQLSVAAIPILYLHFLIEICEIFDDVTLSFHLINTVPFEIEIGEIAAIPCLDDKTTQKKITPIFGAPPKSLPDVITADSTTISEVKTHSQH